MNKYECNFYVNGIRTQQIVTAINDTQARKLIEEQYKGSRISWAGGPKRIG